MTSCIRILGSPKMSGLSEAEAANLKGLESLMEEFFSPGVSNQRKAQIQAMLEEFEQQVPSLHTCSTMYFITVTFNDSALKY